MCHLSHPNIILLVINDIQKLVCSTHVPPSCHPNAVWRHRKASLHQQNIPDKKSKSPGHFYKAFVTLNSLENLSICSLQIFVRSLQISENNLKFSVRSLLFSEKSLQLPIRWQLGGTWVALLLFHNLLIYNKIMLGWERWHICIK